MINLSVKERLLLNSILEEDFGSLDIYSKLVQPNDILRLLSNINQLIILKSYDLSLYLPNLGHLISNDIVFLDKFYREIKRFTGSEYFGESNTDHIKWLNSLDHGYQIYLKVQNNFTSYCFLCIVCKYIPLYKRKLIIKDWLEYIEWNRKVNIYNSIIISYTGYHKIKIYYLESSYKYNLSSIEILNDPKTQIIDKEFIDQLNLYLLSGGYYIFKEINNDGKELNLNLTNIKGINSNISLQKIDDITYFIGKKPDVQILLNANNFYNNSSNNINNNLLNITANLAQI